MSSDTTPRNSASSCMRSQKYRMTGSYPGCPDDVWVDRTAMEPPPTAQIARSRSGAAIPASVLAGNTGSVHYVSEGERRKQVRQECKTRAPNLKTHPNGAGVHGLSHSEKRSKDPQHKKPANSVLFRCSHTCPHSRSGYKAGMGASQPRWPTKTTPSPVGHPTAGFMIGRQRHRRGCQCRGCRRVRLWIFQQRLANRRSC